MKHLLHILKRRAVLFVPALAFMGAAIPAHATAFTSSAYYVGVEDHIGGDYDYNDIVFTLSGAGLTLNSSGTLSNPFTPNNNGFPFFDNLSSDGAGKNFGNCLYTAATNACTGGGPLNPSAQYLSSGGGFAGFDFSGATGSVTFTLTPLFIATMTPSTGAPVRSVAMRSVAARRSLREPGTSTSN